MIVQLQKNVRISLTIARSSIPFRAICELLAQKGVGPAALGLHEDVTASTLRRFTRNLQPPPRIEREKKVSPSNSDFFSVGVVLLQGAYVFERTTCDFPIRELYVYSDDAQQTNLHNVVYARKVLFIRMEKQRSPLSREMRRSRTHVAIAVVLHTISCFPRKVRRVTRGRISTLKYKRASTQTCLAFFFISSLSTDVLLRKKEKKSRKTTRSATKRKTEKKARTKARKGEGEILVWRHAFLNFSENFPPILDACEIRPSR